MNDVNSEDDNKSSGTPP